MCVRVIFGCDDRELMENLLLWYSDVGSRFDK